MRSSGNGGTATSGRCASICARSCGLSSTKTTDSTPRLSARQMSSRFPALGAQFTPTAVKSASARGMSARANARASGAAVLSGGSFFERSTSSTPRARSARRPSWNAANGVTASAPSSETMPRQSVLSASTARTFFGAAPTRKRNSSSTARSPARENGIAASARIRASQNPGVSRASCARSGTTMRADGKRARRSARSSAEAPPSTTSRTASGANAWSPPAGSSASCRQVSKPGAR